MGTLFEKFSVDISQHPEENSINKRAPGDEITIDNAHANTLKVIYFLILNGVLILENGEQDYQKLKNNISSRS